MDADGDERSMTDPSGVSDRGGADVSRDKQSAVVDEHKKKKRAGAKTKDKRAAGAKDKKKKSAAGAKGKTVAGTKTKKEEEDDSYPLACLRATESERQRLQGECHASHVAWAKRDPVDFIRRMGKDSFAKTGESWPEDFRDNAEKMITTFLEEAVAALANMQALRQRLVRTALACLSVLIITLVVAAGVFFLVRPKPEDKPLPACPGEPPEWSHCTCFSHLDNGYYYRSAKARPCKFKLAWTDVCNDRCGGATTTTTQPPPTTTVAPTTAAATSTAATTTTATTTPPPATPPGSATQCKRGSVYYGDPAAARGKEDCSSPSYCYAFAVTDPTIPKQDRQIYFKCYEQKNIKPLNNDTGCGKDIGNGECKLTVADQSIGSQSSATERYAGMLCCCADDLCNMEGTTKTAEKAATKTYACKTGSRDVSPGVEGRMADGLEKQCDGKGGNRGGLCFDAVFKSRQERGCSLDKFKQLANTAIYRECLQKIGVGDGACIKFNLTGSAEDGHACCCRANGTAGCHVGDALAFSRDHVDGVWPTTTTTTTTTTTQPQTTTTRLPTTAAATTTAPPISCQAGDDGAVTCGVGVCYEQLLSDGKMKHGCGDEADVPTRLLVNVCGEQNIARAPQCFTLPDGTSLCCCTTPGCNDGAQMKQHNRLEQHAAPSGLSIGQIAVLAVVALVVVALLAVCVYAAVKSYKARKPYEPFKEQVEMFENTRWFWDPHFKEVLD